MIHLIIATFPEATYFIKSLKLKKIESISEFKVYYNNNFTLTITGLGKLNAAMAITQTYYEFGKIKNHHWINIGIAGHLNAMIGDIFIVNKILDKNSQKCFYLYSPNFNDINSTLCETFDKFNKNYKNSLSDMEASGFYESASKYSSREFIHSIKVVSDNKLSSIDFKNNKTIEELFSRHSKKFNLFFEKIQKTFNKNAEDLNKINIKVEKLISKVSFSKSESEQVKNLLKLFFLKKKKIDLSIFNNPNDKKKILVNLKNLL